MDEYQKAVAKLPPKGRLLIYLIVAFAGAGLSAVAAYFIAIDLPVPAQIRGLLAAVGVLSVAPNLMAAANVPKKDDPVPVAVIEKAEVARSIRDPRRELVDDLDPDDTARCNVDDGPAPDDPEHY